MMRLAVFLALVAPSIATAHETWLLPRAFVVPAGGRAEFDLTSGMEFPTLDHPIKPDRTKRAVLRVGGKTIDLTPTAGEKSLSLAATAPAAGVAVAAVELHPRPIRLAADKVGEYFREIDAPKAVRDGWANTPEPRVWDETYTKHAKAFVRVGAANDDGWKDPIGLGLEIVPDADPTRLTAGTAYSFRVLKGGKPLAGLAVGVATETGGNVGFRPTDATGRIAVTFAKPGRALLYGTDLRPPAKAGEPYLSDFTTLTLSVAAK